MNISKLFYFFWKFNWVCLLLRYVVFVVPIFILSRLHPPPMYICMKWCWFWGLGYSTELLFLHLPNLQHHHHCVGNSWVRSLTGQINNVRAVDWSHCYIRLNLTDQPRYINLFRQPILDAINKIMNRFRRC